MNPERKYLILATVFLLIGIILLGARYYLATVIIDTSPPDFGSVEPYLSDREDDPSIIAPTEVGTPTGLIEMKVTWYDTQTKITKMRLTVYYKDGGKWIKIDSKEFKPSTWRELSAYTLKKWEGPGGSRYKYEAIFDFPLYPDFDLKEGKLHKFYFEAWDEAGNKGTETRYAVFVREKGITGKFYINDKEMRKDSRIILKTRSVEFKFKPDKDYMYDLIQKVWVEIYKEGNEVGKVTLTRSGDVCKASYTFPGDGTYEVYGYVRDIDYNKYRLAEGSVTIGPQGITISPDMFWILLILGFMFLVMGFMFIAILLYTRH